VGGDTDAVSRENERLRREARELRARIDALETSRWWRLHPRFVLRRPGGGHESAEEAAPVRQWFPHDFDEADIELYERVEPYTMTPPPRIYALARAVEYVGAAGVRGAIVECGVWRGGSMMAAALTLLRAGVDDRELYLFDTFEGMTDPGDEDVRHTGERAADVLAGPVEGSHAKAAASIDEVRNALHGVGYPRERLHFVQGPVEETLPGSAPETIALLRLDTDWYSSTKHELEHLYPRLVPGGVLIIDDYAHWEGSRRAVDEYLAEHGLPLLLNRIDNNARIAVKLR
jgi:O-methyltransferase